MPLPASASRLETSLGQSEQSVCELSQALNQSEDQLSQLRTLSQSQSAEIQQLRDVCTQLSGVREMNEVFLFFLFGPCSTLIAGIFSNVRLHTLSPSYSKEVVIVGTRSAQFG